MQSHRTRRNARRRWSKHASTNGRTLHVLELPDDVLYVIFSKCDVQSLGNLSSTCHKFNQLLQKDSPWLHHIGGLMLIRGQSNRRHVGKHNAPTWQRSCKMCLKEHCRISRNWTNTYFQNENLLHFNKRQLPWMQYENDTLWVSSQNVIRCYHVKNDGRLSEQPQRHLQLPSHDVSRFVIRDNLALSGCRDGNLYMFDCTSGRPLLQFNNVHVTDAQAVDFTDTCMVSGSRDHTVKVLHAEQEANSNPVRKSLNINDRVWSLSIAPSGRSVSVGTAGCYSASVTVWDLERGEKLHDLDTGKFGAGSLDVQYDDEHTLLSCGYDSMLRLWDTRTAKCQLSLMEPHDSTLYCLQSDGDVAIVTGTSHYGMVRLWDKRYTKPVQLFYLGQKKSPVYSVAMDTSRLYAALDTAITMADFSLLPP